MSYREAIGVAILTNANRLKFLKNCIQSFVENCYYRPLIFGVFNNGSTDGTKEYLETLPKIYGVEWRVDSEQTDIGCAPGTNRACNIVNDCEYVIHLESDFTHMKEKESGVPRLWLHEAVDFMTDGRCDYLYLRRMRDEKEMMMHFWSQWMPQTTTEEGPFLECPPFWFSQNPHLRRNKAIYDSKTLPMKEFYDDAGNPTDFKGTEFWNKSEMNCPKPPNTWIYKWGMFTHESSLTEFPVLTGCRKHTQHGTSTCKYGFYKDDINDRWCKQCDFSTIHTDMAKHEERYRRQ